MNELPQVVLNALNSNEYIKREGYSATTLLKPVQMKLLQDRYGDDEKENVLDNVWSVLGTAVHGVFEKYAEEDALVEKHYSVNFGDLNVHGTVDHYRAGTISDFKVTSSWKYVGKDFSDWEKQLNIYAYLMGEDFPVEKLQIIALFRDWSEMQAKRSPDYPQQQIVVIPIKLWTKDEQFEFIRDRLALFEDYSHADDNKLLPCTDKDRWYTGTKYAVMKKGNKRAVKLFESVYNAHEYALKDPKYYVEERIGENKRCSKYCPVYSKCHQIKELNG